MATTPNKRFAVLLSGAPHSTRSQAGLDIALATAALGQAVTLILLDDALLHLLPGDHAAPKSVDFATLRHYGIAPIHGSSTALEILGVKPAQLREDIEINWLDHHAIRKLLHLSDVLLSF